MNEDNDLVYPQLTLTPKQSIAYDLLTDNLSIYTLFGGGAGGGKSWLGAAWLVLMCYDFPETRWFIGRKELKRLMSSTYVTLLKVFKFLQIPDNEWTLNGQYNYIQFKNGSRIDLLDLAYQPSDPLYERFGSLEYTGGWIEEAGEVDFLAFDVLKTRIGRQLNKDYNLLPKMLLTCNPTKNWLYRTFYKPSKNNSLPTGYKFVQSLYKDNTYTAEEYGHQLNSITDPVLRARLRDGFWEYDESDLALMVYDQILELFENQVEYNIDGFITADVARFGSDKVVIGIWRGLNLVRIIEKSKQDTDRTARDIRDLSLQEQIPYSKICVDEDGMGAGVVDQLKGVRGFIGNSSPLKNPKDERKENYKNLRSQCAFMLSDKVNRHEMAISAQIDETQRETIIEDLQQFRRVDTSQDAPLQLVAKEEMKANLGRSPDYADMLSMRMIFELEKPPVYHQPNPDMPRAFSPVKRYINGVG